MARMPLKAFIRYEAVHITPESGPLVPLEVISADVNANYSNETYKNETIFEEEENTFTQSETVLTMTPGEDKDDRSEYGSIEALAPLLSTTKRKKKRPFKSAISMSSSAVKALGKSLGFKKSGTMQRTSSVDSIGQMSTIESITASVATPSDENSSQWGSQHLVQAETTSMITTLIEDDDSSITVPVMVHKLSEVHDRLKPAPEQEFFQISITVVEAEDLPGSNLNPYVVVQVDDQKKQTAVKESTSTPYFDEFFAFEYNTFATLLFDKIITITVHNSRGMLRSDKVIGSCKLDVGTVFKQADHQFYHKWVVLTDPDDLFSTTKGFVKCDIAVIGKGYNALTASSRKEVNDSDNVYENLILPPHVSVDRPATKFVVTVYRADGLPRYSPGFFSTMKRTISSSSRHIVNPYVVVTFAGLQAKTKVFKKSCCPVWNEKITFFDLFPPLFQKIKIQIRDNQTANDSLIATHYITLSSISNDGSEGFLPTFGPSFVHFYGSLVGNQETDVATKGDEDAIAYRGRLLISISTEILDGPQQVPKSQVAIEPVSAVNENLYGKAKDFLCFISIFESLMIPKKYGGKKISYEISIGNPEVSSQSFSEDFGSQIGDEKLLEDIADTLEKDEDEKDKEERLDVGGNWVRTNRFKSACSGNGMSLFHLPIADEKPCLYMVSSWPDNKRRVYHSNVLSQIADGLELGILDVEEMMRMERDSPERRLQGVFEELLFGCNKFLALSVGSGGAAAGHTKLDKERTRIIQRGMEKIAKDARDKHLKITKQNLNLKLKLAKLYLEKIREVSENPQHGIPDIFLWMIVSGKRVAYCRLPAKDYLYSVIKDESGRYCGKLHDLYFRIPGKPDYEIVNKLRVYVWYGSIEHKQHFAKGLPRGYIDVDEFRYADDLKRMPPKEIVYQHKHLFQKRAHIYQARSLIAADSSGLSDPYVKVCFGEQCLKSQIIKETLSPIWDELLLFSEVTLYGNREDIKQNTATVVVEVFDEDRGGQDDFLGRAVAVPSVRFADEPYRPGVLEWLDVWKGREEAGQLLAAFELVQIHEKDDESEYPRFLPVSSKPGKKGKVLYSVPQQIRPTLSKFRLEVLFWGLRDIQKTQFATLDRPRVDVDCCGEILSSTVITNFKRHPNFQDAFKSMDLLLPEQDIYSPPLTIRVVDIKAFGREVLVGTHTVRSILKYKYRDDYVKPHAMVLESKTINIDPAEYLPPHEEKKERSAGNRRKSSAKNQDENSVDDLDWWSRYYASKDFIMNGENSGRSTKVPKHMLIRILPCELENDPIFKGDLDFLRSFELSRGKQVRGEDERSRYVGLFRGMFGLHKFPLKMSSLSDSVPNTSPVKILVRVYIVQATDLSPTDSGGKSDPYIVVCLGDKKASDKDRYVPNTLNPVFGRCFEFEATFPQDSFITVQIKDFDLIGKNELIGETKIDLEARYYSNFRQYCGVAKTFEKTGANKWRDSVKPTQILNSFAKQYKTSCIFEKRKIRLGNITFTFKKDGQEDLITISENERANDQFALDVEPEEEPLDAEEMATAVLNNWDKVFGFSLATEHVEVRPLYIPEKPGVEQGQIEMWVDMFPTDMPQPPPHIDISPRKPVSHELRVIIWNTDEVTLDDTNPLTGESMSDIYVKGWLTDPNEAQSTDVHYRSMTGEGNFNWRMIFGFDYAAAEEKIVVTKKESLFSWDESETKIPPRLCLQIWDADLVSADDFLGALTLDLNNFPRAAKTTLSCTLDMIQKDSNYPKMSIFKANRVRGWWPCVDKDENGELVIKGKVEAELHLLTKKEAEDSPAGLGRNEPDPLEKPNRPETSFMWFMNPWKTLKYVIWRNFKGVIIKGLVFGLIGLFFALFVYSLPGYTANRLMGALL